MINRLLPFGIVALAVTVVVLVGTADARGPRSGGRRPATGVRRDTLTPEQVRLNHYIDTTARGLDKRMRGALEKIDGAHRKLLALKYYLQRGRPGAGWAWTNREIASYRRSVAYRIANAEVDKVRMTFAKQNPGYDLQVIKDVRGLEEQIRLWNTTGQIDKAGKNLVKSMLKAMSTDFPDTATRAAMARFQAQLKKQRVYPTPTVATPGFSHHGQLRAYDFIIKQGESIVAGTDAGSIGPVWVASGWSQRLRTAIYTASNRFDGPLQSPNEPWHYTYIR